MFTQLSHVYLKHIINSMRFTAPLLLIMHSDVPGVCVALSR